MIGLRLFAAALILAAIPAAPAFAQVDSFLFGKPLTKTIAPGLFQVTARGNNMRTRRSSYDEALRKAAKHAAKKNGRWMAVVREKTGSWSMNGGAIGDETTLRIKLVDGPGSVLDDKGNPARVYEVSEILGRTR